MAFVNPVAPDGTFRGVGDGWPEIEGKLVTDKETNRIIIERLKQDGRWLETRAYTHSYPHCWRCDSPLIYYARSSWFVRTTAVKVRMLEINAEVDWHPAEVGTGRFGEWLAINVTAVDAPVYKHVIVNEHVLDVHGQKMSKSRGNVVDPWKVIGEHGADAVRLYLLGQSQ